MAVTLFALSACGNHFEDPADARCDSPQATFADPVDQGDHQQVDAHFTCEGAVQAGVLYVPNGPGPHPAVVWVHGGGEALRLGYGAFIADLVQGGVAFFTYDKRGVGESLGKCCPGDFGHFNLLTADVEGAVIALRSRSDIDPDQIGLIGASQAGWIAPRAAVEANAAFLALASAGILPYGQVKEYAQLTGGSESDKPFPSKEEIAKRLEDAGPSGFDPKPFLEELAVPALWLFGTADREVPVDASVALLTALKDQGHDFTITTFPDAGHGLLDTTPTAADAPRTLVDWVSQHVRVSIP
jgi:dipeptidyl aminopeptidase/acylaminoacyl peptidase